MTKNNPSWRFFILVCIAVIGVIAFVRYADTLTHELTDCKQSTNYGALTALFTGIGFIAAIWQLHQRKLDQMANEKRNEIERIERKITELQVALANKNNQFASIKQQAQNVTKLDDIIYSNEIYKNIQRTHAESYKIYSSNRANSVEEWEKFALVNFINCKQKFLEIAFPLRRIYHMIDISDTLDEEDKNILAEEAYTIFNTIDIKLLTILYISDTFDVYKTPVQKSFDEFFDKESAIKLICSLNQKLPVDFSKKFAALLEQEAENSKKHKLYYEIS